MNLKLMVSATAAALLALSTASFGQSGTSARPTGSSGSNIGGTPPAMSGGTSNGTAGNGSSATGASSAAAHCAGMTGAERDRCMKEAGAAANGGDSTTKMRPEGSSGSNIGGVPPRMDGSSSGTTR